MRIKYKTLDTNQISAITVENTKCIDIVSLPDIDVMQYVGLVIWEHQKDYRRMVLSDATGGYTIIARCQTISPFAQKPLKPLLNRLKRELRNNTPEIDLTEEKTDLNLNDACKIMDGKF